jgi:hypothetical protein
MEKKPLIQNEIDYYHNEAIRMIVKEEKLPSQVKRGLMQLGADEGVASEIANSAQDLVREAKIKKANKDVVFGSLWCVGGTVLTLADVGFIFWGAILFGGIQLINGLVSRG